MAMEYAYDAEVGAYLATLRRMQDDLNEVTSEVGDPTRQRHAGLAAAHLSAVIQDLSDYLRDLPDPGPRHVVRAGSAES